ILRKSRAHVFSTSSPTVGEDAYVRDPAEGGAQINKDDGRNFEELRLMPLVRTLTTPYKGYVSSTNGLQFHQKTKERVNNRTF
ncbi:MAG: hypothetical protein KBS70_00385, partial [Bacteroidales bacterium]|nr:hypothetical protein [Candidatus Colicola equi]